MKGYDEESPSLSMDDDALITDNEEQQQRLSENYDEKEQTLLVSKNVIRLNEPFVVQDKNEPLFTMPELDYIESFLSNLPSTIIDSSRPMITNIPTRPLLGEKEKKSRHVQSEHKRRSRIKDELFRMTTLVSTTGNNKERLSQSRLLEKANDYIEQLERENVYLKNIIMYNNGQQALQNLEMFLPTKPS